MKKLLITLFWIFVIAAGARAIDIAIGYVEISLNGDSIEKIPVEEYQGRVRALNYFGELMRAEMDGRVFLNYTRHKYDVIWKDKDGKIIKEIYFEQKDKNKLLKI